MNPGPDKDLKGQQTQAIFNIIVILCIKTCPGLHKSPEFVSWIQQIVKSDINCCSGMKKKKR